MYKMWNILVYLYVLCIELVLMGLKISSICVSVIIITFLTYYDVVGIIYKSVYENIYDYIRLDYLFNVYKIYDVFLF